MKFIEAYILLHSKQDGEDRCAVYSFDAHADDDWRLTGLRRDMAPSVAVRYMHQSNKQSGTLQNVCIDSPVLPEALRDALPPGVAYAEPDRVRVFIPKQ